MLFPDSIAVYIEKENKVVFKGEAVILILHALKWPWKGAGILLRWIPVQITNFFYDCLAKIRHKLFKHSNRVCVPIPQKWKKLFEDEGFLH